MKISVYSTNNANGLEGKKRCIYQDILKGFKQNYNFEYLTKFFEEKAREYCSISVADDEKYYELRKQFPNHNNIITDFSRRDNYFSALQIVWVVKTLKFLYDRGYDFQITNIASERDGWIMVFTFDFSNLTEDQVEIVLLNAFEQNQLNPNNIVG